MLQLIYISGIYLHIIQKRIVYLHICIVYLHTLHVIINRYRRLDSDRDAIRKKVYPLEQMDERNTAHMYELRFLKNQC